MNNSAKKYLWVLLSLFAILSGLVVFGVVKAQGGLTTYYNDSDVPLISPRSTWDSTLSLNALMTWLPQNIDYPSDWQPVERIVIHDTGCDTTNSTCNSNSNPIATIQAIYRYHAVTRGWGDIGYNYIIDQQGRIYEGRYGGNGSRGAHTYYDRAYDNFNYGSIGIVVLGNYANTQVPQAVYTSLTRLVGWLAAMNGLDPEGQSSSYIWNATKGGFKTFYSGPVVVGHKNLEPGNPDPGMVDLNRVRKEAAVFAVKDKNYVYQKNDGGSAIYKIISGSRQIFDNLTAFVNQGNLYSKLVSLSSTQIDLFSEGRFLKYPDGSLVQIKPEPTVYLIENGKKRPFNVTAKQFLSLGFDFNNVKQVTVDELINYLDGIAIKYGPDKQLLSDGTKIYLIESGKKRWISSNQLFSILGFSRSKVKKSDLAQIITYLDGDPLLYPDGTLLRSGGNPTVYLMKGGQKHQFVSAQSFLKLGYKWGKVLSADSAEIAQAPSGNIISYADGTLVQAENSASVFLINKGLLHQFVSSEIFLNMKYKWSQVLTVSSDELSYYTQGDPVKYPDGTLLRPKDAIDVYLIADGIVKPVDAATFKKKKYNWSNVLVVSSQDFGVLYNGQPIASLATISQPMTSSSTSPIVATSTITVAPAASVMPKIRIAIFEVTDPAVSFTADTSYDVLNKNGQVVISKKAGEIYSYNVGTPADAFVKIVPVSVDGIVQVTSYEDHPAWKPTLNYNKFHGAIEIVYSNKSVKVWAVNELALEDYLRGIAETGQTDPTEYQKTMMVAARTYAYYYILKGGKRGADEVYHLNNMASDQLYKGYVRETLAPAVIDAVSATRGEIAVYNNLPIVAAYSSGAAELQTSGTKSACAVWGSNYCQAGFEYLAGGVKDPVGTEYNYSSCSGANHCVGLSGAGTRQFAKTGTKNYQEILKYYYPGTEIKKIY
jgi:hypothetical protein